MPLDRNQIRKGMFLTHDCGESRCYIADRVMKEQEPPPTLQQIGERIKAATTKAEATLAALRAGNAK